MEFYFVFFSINGSFGIIPNAAYASVSGLLYKLENCEVELYRYYDLQISFREIYNFFGFLISL